MACRNMKKLVSILTIFCIVGIFLLNSCKSKPAYFVISDQISAADKNIMSKTVSSLKGCPPPPPEITNNTFKAPKNWYTPLVIVLDSTDKVYIYQTETTERAEHKYHETCQETTKYSNFIGLLPEHLITFRSKDFIEFIMDNHDIFELDTTRNDSTARIITIASSSDTIKNQAFYDLQKLTSMYILGSKSSENLIPIKESKNTPHSICVVRKTTEEEDVVIYHKRNKLQYNPEKIKWSNDFINGKCKPFTQEYDSLENEMMTKQKAIFGIKKVSRKILKIM